MSERPERLYRFDPLDTSGIFLGLGLLQCAFLGGGLVAAVLAVTAGLPLVVAVVPVLLGGFGSFARVGGFAIWEWLPIAISWIAARLGRGERWLVRLPLLEDEIADLPPCLAGLDIVEVPWRGSTAIGAVRDREAGTLTALLDVAGPEFVTQPRAEQESLLAGWGDVLAQFATEGSPVLHVGWSDFARPSGMSQHVEWLATTGSGSVHVTARASYEELLEGAASQASSHDVLVFLTVTRDRLGRRAQIADPEAALARALTSSLEALLRAVRGAGLHVADPVPTSAVRRHLRVRIDPFRTQPTVNRGRLVERLGLVRETTAGPTAVEARWSHVAVDRALHRTYWVAGYPRLPQHPAWLEPFLSAPGISRTMTVLLAPVSAHQSRRRIERDLVKLESDAESKEEKGHRVDARHRRATKALLDREEELVAGFPEMGYVSLVCVSGPDEETLDEHSEIVEQLARDVGLELRSLDARHDLAWAASLPFGLQPRHQLV